MLTIDKDKFWEVAADDPFPWNTRLKRVKAAFLNHNLMYSREDLDYILRESLYRFQVDYHGFIMRWANAAGIGPGFVVE